MSKRNLDKLFQEKLKNYQEEPDEKVWTAIEASLDQKKKSRQLVPIWWKLGGIAAALAVLLYVINPFGADEGTQNVITDTEQPADVIDSENIENRDAQGFDKGSEEGLTEVENTHTPPSKENPSKEVQSVVSDRTLTQKNAGERETQNAIDQKKRLQTQEESALTGVDQPQSGRETVIENSSTLEDAKENTRQRGEAVAAAKDPSKTVSEDQKLPGVTTKDSSKEGELSNETGIVEAVQEDPEEASKKSIFEEIEKEDEEVVAQASGSRWSVGPSVAPVYFNSLGEGSPIHSNFAANSKSGNINLSYGLSVSYEVTDKLSIRSGIHKVDYGYDTNDVLFTSSLAAANSQRIDNIDYASTSKNLVVESTTSPASAADFALNSNEIAAPDATRNGRMVQQFGYLEVPVELNYALVDKKLGFHLIGGVSSLFLVNNSVSLESEGGSTEMGEANNINDVNFSTNVGFGVRYRVSPKVQMNLEPMFKYQLNTFSDAAGDFRPFSVGVYSGLKFKF